MSGGRTKPQRPPLRHVRLDSTVEALGSGRLRLWRVTRDADSWAPAEGAGRWSLRPGAMIYASTTAALAVLEARAHLEAADARRAHHLAWIEVPVRAGEVHCVSGEKLPPQWKRRKPLTRALGESWLERGDAVALLVPSALAAGEMNVLIDPAHRRWPAWRRLALERPFRFDARLLRTPM